MLLLMILVSVAGLAKICYDSENKNSEFRFKGQTYVVAGLQGAGYTRQHRSPVYTLVIMAKEDTKKWTKKRD